MTLIKAVHMPKYSIELVEIEGEYIVCTEDARDSDYTEPVSDLNTALAIFERKSIQLAGQ